MASFGIIGPRSMARPLVDYSREALGKPFGALKFYQPNGDGSTTPQLHRASATIARRLIFWRSFTNWVARTSGGVAQLETHTARAQQNMGRQSKRYFLLTSEGFEVDVTIDATGKYYSNLRTKAPPDSTKSQYDRAMLEVDIWLEDTFGGFRNKLARLKERPRASRYHRLRRRTRI